MKKKFWPMAVIFGSICWVPSAGVAEPPIKPAGILIREPYRGVRHVEYKGASPRPIRVNIVQIDLRALGIRFLVTPYNPAGGRATMKETALQFLNSHKDEGARIAVNAHFFEPWPPPKPDNGAADLVGLAASSATSKGPGAAHGAPHAFSPFTSQPPKPYALQPNAPALNIDESNRAQIVHRRKNDTTGYKTEEDVELYNTIAGCAQIVTAGADTTPNLDWYTSAKNLKARTVIGLSRDNKTLTLFTVDQAGESKGMNVTEVARFLLDDPAGLLPRGREVYNALCLDGGGSSTLAMIDPKTGQAKQINSPSRGSPVPVGSNFAVLVRDTDRQP